MKKLIGYVAMIVGVLGILSIVYIETKESREENAKQEIIQTNNAMIFKHLQELERIKKGSK